MTRRIPFTAAILALLSSPQPGFAQSAVAEHAGRCDASAIAVAPNLFVVANDEDNVLRAYRLGEPAPVGEWDLNSFLKTAPKNEVDIEGVARIGDVVYWISSHGRNKDGERKSERERLFATEIKAGDGGRLDIRGLHKPYETLLTNLADAPALAKYKLRDAARLKPEAEGGLNIEGLAATPDGRLLIAFRNPLPGGKALVVPLLNPERVVKGEEEAKFGAAIELDLGGRGVRSIDYVEARKAFVVVAGPPADTGGFKLFQWSGPGGPSLTAIEQIGFGDLKPEALSVVPGSDALQVVSDDGGRKLEGEDCKDLGTSK